MFIVQLTTLTIVHYSTMFSVCHNEAYPPPMLPLNSKTIYLTLQQIEEWGSNSYWRVTSLWFLSSINSEYPGSIQLESYVISCYLVCSSYTVGDLQVLMYVRHSLVKTHSHMVLYYDRSQTNPFANDSSGFFCYTDGLGMCSFLLYSSIQVSVSGC